MSPHGKAKFWLEPTIELAHSVGLSQQDENHIFRVVKEHEHEIRQEWHRHFGS
jgi:hypothetical protein